MSDYKVGYKKPPLEGRIKRGERRNPNGRRGKKSTPAPVASDVDILKQIDNELIDYHGKMITMREAEIRVLQARSLKGDAKATQLLESIRKNAGAHKPAQGGGVLLVPMVGTLDDWEVMAAKQQAKFRGEDPEALAELQSRYGEAFGSKDEDESG